MNCPTCHGPMKPLFGTKEFCPNDCDRPGGGPKAVSVKDIFLFIEPKTMRRWTARLIQAGSVKTGDEIPPLLPGATHGYWTHGSPDEMMDMVQRAFDYNAGPYGRDGTPGWQFSAANTSIFTKQFLEVNDLLIFKEVT